MKTTVSLFGYGRFGQLWAEILAKQFSVLVYDPNVDIQTTDSIRPASLEEALTSSILIYAVPIPLFEATVTEHLARLQNDTSPRVFMDVLSVKVLPKRVFTSLLHSHHETILTHPMFGPDSVRTEGLAGQPLVLDGSGAKDNTRSFWKSFFSDCELNVLSMTAEEHDQLAAKSQGLTHFIGRVLDEFGIQETSIDTLGARQLLAIREQTCNDTWELFSGLQTENPYTAEMRVQLGTALEKIYSKLLPRQRDPEVLTVGIQGGNGSFNEEAALYYLKRQKIEHYKIHYLYTTERVLQSLHEGAIDCGQFAVHNSTGGIVEESLLAMAQRRFFIREQFSILIAHSLMTKKGVSTSHIDTIMTHPQVLKQCRKNLSEKYPRLKQTSGEGELIDSANVARALTEGELSDHHAVMGSKILADIYDLEIVEEGLQDLNDNFTSFLWVERPYE